MQLPYVVEKKGYWSNRGFFNFYTIRCYSLMPIILP